MEGADVSVVNKSDRPGAEETAASLTVVGHGRDGRIRPVATTGEGVDALAT